MPAQTAGGDHYQLPALAEGLVEADGSLGTECVSFSQELNQPLVILSGMMTIAQWTALHPSTYKEY